MEFQFEACDVVNLCFEEKRASLNGRCSGVIRYSSSNTTIATVDVAGRLAVVGVVLTQLPAIPIVMFPLRLLPPLTCCISLTANSRISFFLLVYGYPTRSSRFSAVIIAIPTAGFGVGFTIGGPPGALIGGAVGFAVGSLVSIGFAMASRRTST